MITAQSGIIYNKLILDSGHVICEYGCSVDIPGHVTSAAQYSPPQDSLGLGCLAWVCKVESYWAGLTFYLPDFRVSD